MVSTVLVVSSDAQAVQVLSRILEGRGMRVQHCKDSRSAEALLAEQRFQAVIVDCEDESAAISLLDAIRAQPAQAASLVVAIVDDKNEVRELFSHDVSFMLYKPVSAERAANSLRAAWPMLPGERRRKRRIPVATKAAISYAATEDAAAPLLNLSGDGVAILSSHHLPAPSRVYFQFNLPGQAAPVRLAGEVVWQDSRGRVGLQFSQVPQASRRVLDQWLQVNLAQHPENQDLGSALETAEDQRDEPQFLHLYQTIDPNAERRAQSRQSCRFGVDVYRDGGKSRQHCTLTDMSVGGCYVETTQPLPAGSTVVLEVHTHELKVRVPGKVKSMHPGYGMGIEFSLRTPDDKQQVARLIAGMEPQVEVSSAR
jgi:CheY-like chemotaxis protein